MFDKTVIDSDTLLFGNFENNNLGENAITYPLVSRPCIGRSMAFHEGNAGSVDTWSQDIRRHVNMQQVSQL